MLRKVFHDIDKSREYPSVEALHEFLVEGDDLDACARRIRAFLDSYQLVRYGSIAIDRKRSLPAADPGFLLRLDEALAENAGRIRAFLDELRQDGFERMEQLEVMPQGYQSKTLHTVTHLLDGFFGIDSFFYNLVEGSHGLTGEMRARMEAAPQGYMLVAVKASI
jgi:hypothetical protein